MNMDYGTNRDSLLELLGLQMKKPSTDHVMSALALFSTGLLVGASLGLLFAPASGEEIREDIAKRIRKGERQARGRLPDRPATSSATSQTQRATTLPT